MQVTFTPDEIRAARDKVAELALMNPLLTPVFDRLDREYELAKAGRQPVSRLEVAARRRRRTRDLV